MINYYYQDTDFVFNEQKNTDLWLNDVVTNEKKVLCDISIIFCSDSYLLDINKKFLSHNYYTDIITFDYCDEVNNLLSGDLFISVETVKDNANYYEVNFDEELNRVIVHGILHLIGYDDHTESEILQMRDKENFYLNHRKRMF